ncbi:MAG TPA: gamma-glutamyltransferase [Burkholderiaceae bacterium]|nr:gamma-glutamyltransferase [Burkholderiaceae bacterium]
MKLSPTRTALAVVAALTLAAPAWAQAPSQPEAASGFATKRAVQAHKFMVASANPLATDAGYEMLKRGGSAVDAAIAVQLVLTLVEPQSSGIGGGAFMLFFDNRKDTVTAFDGRETAPAAATDALFLGPDGKPLAFYEGVVGGRSVGVPGVVRLMELAHAQYGKLPWADLFAPAIRLATDGFAVSPRLNALLASEQHLKKDPVAARYFYDAEGKPRAVGSVLKNPELAATLKALASEGASAFYRGPIAKDIVAKVQGHPSNPGKLSLYDMVFYAPKQRQALCSDYRQWTVCGMPPPSSGGIAVAQILGIVQGSDIARAKPTRQADGTYAPDAKAVHLFSEAGRLAFADRGLYVADPDFVAIPAGLTAPAYLKERAALIGDKSMGRATPGDPGRLKTSRAPDQSPELPSTSHISVVDAAGNAVSMTTSIEDQFGARQMVRGFLLNNQLTDFSFVSSENGKPVANRVQPGKRPRSSMAPTLVFGKGRKPGELGELVLVTGSPGGSQIIGYVARTLLGTLDWELDIQQAISMPNYGSRNGPTEVEKGRMPAAVVEGLKARGHEVREIDMTSGIQGIARSTAKGKTVLTGGADPRREGTVRGD